jgi:DNA-binding NarL/FixJ family response regulator
MLLAIIHDEPGIQTVIKGLIEGTGNSMFEIKVSNNTLNEIREARPDYLIIQLSLLYNMSSQFISMLKRISGVKIWVVSGSMDNTIATEMLKAGADKAFNILDLNEILRKAGLIR